MKIWLLALFIVQISWAHGGEDHSSPSSDEIIKQEVIVDSKKVQDEEHDHVGHHENLNESNDHENHIDVHSEVKSSKVVEAKIGDFPSLHPLIVHFPIVLLVLIPFILLGWIWRQKKELLYLSIGISLAASLTSYLASSFVHPHTSGMTKVMNEVLANHDFWAYSTTISSVILSIGLISLIKINQFKIMKYLVLCVAIFSAVAVSFTGHYGATLTHIHSVGAQGKYLEKSHEH